MRVAFTGWPVRLLSCTALAIFCVAEMHAQSSEIRIAGRVLDPSGAPILNARITATVQDCASERAIAPHHQGCAPVTAVSGQNGEFALLLRRAAYTLTFAAEGFTDAARTVNLTGNPPAALVIELQVLPQKETVTVTEIPGYQVVATTTATKTPTPLLDIPQSISVVPRELIKDQMMMSIGDVVRYVAGITAIQGENNRDQVVIRGNSSSADFFLDGVRDDVQYYRDLYNVERVEALKGSNAMIFGRGGGGGVINRVSKHAEFMPVREIELQGGSFGKKRFAADFDQPLGNKAAFRLNGMYENSDSFRRFVNLERYGINPTFTVVATGQTKIMFGYEKLHDGRTADRGIPSFQSLPADVPIPTFFGNPDNSRVRADVNLGSVTIEHQMGRVNIRNHTLAGDYDRSYQNYVPGAVNTDKTLVALSAYNNATWRRNAFNQTDVTYGVSTGALRHTLLWGAEFGHQHTENFRNTGYFNNKAPVVSVLQRDGEVRSVHVERVTSDNLKSIIAQTVAPDAHLMTDTSTTVRGIGWSGKHDMVNHSIDEYARHEDGLCITTNSVESYFAIVKRGNYGVFHHWGRDYTDQYLREFDFRYNGRKLIDDERTGKALKASRGKRLMLKEPKSSAKSLDSGKMPLIL